ncbi:ubiquitin carboxyl-terminal hydrolase 14 [Hyalella azteca]|uniref:Ubiquitin carboxyl-terminal hydrolase n=1 Tax=Hyalella azteca TaxID=294128 RepID=A0A8B7NR09_HYAAZ|nr:ubiquitin carboxyl-terminal hydrolase 14 [Hyalella azteca]
MSCYKVKVKWGKETYPDVELDTSESPEVFQAQVYALTGVQISRQKLLLKGTTLKSDTWEGAKLKDGALVVLMGSRDEDALQEPQQKPVFLEDLSEDQTNVALDMPVGIKNLGNTCYLNAVVQCLKTVPELHKTICKFDPQNDATSRVPSTNAMLMVSIRRCFEEMDKGETPMPVIMVQLFRTCFPRFAEKGAQGSYMQQDASECWTELLRMMQECLGPIQPELSKPCFRSSLVEQYMNGEMESVWTCTEEGGEAPTTTVSTFNQLSCHISTDVNHLHTGLLSRLTETISKHSPALGKDASFTKKSLITRLPAYLAVDMVRFYYKEKEAVNAKILKDVKFSLVLDVFELCSPKLQRRMAPYRVHYKDMEEREKLEARMRKSGKSVPESEQPKLKTIPYYFEDDVGSCNSGFYQLQAVLTHQGRTSSSGHYVAWVRFKDGHWLKCDDDDVTAVTEEEILRLSGGGDWHCAYMLLYGPRPLTVPEDVVIEKVSEEEVPGHSDEKKDIETDHLSKDEKMET